MTTYIQALKAKLNLNIPDWTIYAVGLLLMYFILVWIFKHFLSDTVSKFIAVLLIGGGVGLYFFLNADMTFF